MTRSEWWSEQCPERGPGLNHAHWAKCNPDKTHPGTTTQHPAKMCCHCEVEQDAPKAAPREERRSRWATEDHEFKFTIAGCAYCRKPEEFHPVFIPHAEGECKVDHDSITPALLVGDSGLEWRSCPVCGMQVEPKMATGQAQGRRYGPGRLPWTQRRWEKIVTLKHAFEAGYYQS